jgi:hypothetical protein
MSKILVFLLLLVLGFVSSLLYVHIAKDIIELYDVPYLSKWTYIQLYGLAFFVSMFKVDLHVALQLIMESDKPSDKPYGYNELIRLLTHVFCFLTIWGLAYITHNIIS